MHKFSCRLGRPLDSADHLKLNCWDDRLPSEDSVLKDFDFCHFEDGRSKLLGLFQGLVRQTCGTLRQNIIDQYSKIPESNRRGYYTWLLKQKHLFDATPPPIVLQEDWLRLCRHHLDPEDRYKTLGKL